MDLRGISDDWLETRVDTRRAVSVGHEITWLGKGRLGNGVVLREELEGDTVAILDGNATIRIKNE